MKITNLPILGAFLGLSLLGCRGGGSGGNNTTPDGPTGSGSDSGPTVVHIQDVQSDTMAPGAAVELHGVIVTAIDKFGAKTGDFWVEEPGGGERSGVHVFGAPAAQVANLAVGDMVDITGAIKSEFALSSDTTGRTVTEIQAPKGGMLTVTRTGTGTVPSPHVIDALALDAMTQAQRDAEYEKWEGVLIEVQNVTSRSYPQGFGSKPYPDDSYKVNVTDNLVLESTQAKFAAIDGLTCFASITGVEDYFFDWLILPRSTADMATGAGCAAVNPAISTISDIQATLPAGIVELDNVYVTGVSNGKQSFWISTSPAAATNEGAFVFQSSTTIVLDPAIVAGVQVNVIGKVTEFNDDTMGGTLTEIQPLRITVVNGTATTPTPISGQTAAQLLDPATALLYESVLVTLDNVAITAIGTTNNGFVATATQTVAQTKTTFGIGTDIVQLKTANLGCYSSLTGFWTNLEAGATGATTKPNAFGFIVRDLGTAATTCN